MICSCPKCTNEIELDVAEIPEAGKPISCQACKARFEIVRESFAGRASRKAGEIYCIKCGNSLGHTLHCPGCDILYPDYYVVETAEARRQKQRQKRWASIKELNFSFTADTTSIVAGGYSPERSTGVAASPNVTKARRNMIVIVAGLAIVVALTASGVKMYKQHKLERKYAMFFTKTLYTIKSGTDYSLLVSDKTIKQANDKGILRITAEDEASLNKVKGIADQHLQQLKEPPTKYTNANESFGKVYAAYAKLHSTVVAPSGTTQSFSDAVAQYDNNFRQAAKELKANLPEELSQDLKNATVKYKALADF